MMRHLITTTISTRMLKWCQAKRPYQCPVRTPFLHLARRLHQCPARRLPMSNQESKATTPMSSQESMTRETPMPHLETATGTTILDATDKAQMEDEACLEGPMLKCSLQEERVLLNPLLAESLDHLEDVPLGYLSLIEAHINEIWRIQASRMPVASPRVSPRVPECLHFCQNQHQQSLPQHQHLVKPFTQPPAT